MRKVWVIVRTCRGYAIWCWRGHSLGRGMFRKAGDDQAVESVSSFTDHITHLTVKKEVCQFVRLWRNGQVVRQAIGLRDSSEFFLCGGRCDEVTNLAKGCDASERTMRSPTKSNRSVRRSLDTFWGRTAKTKFSQVASSNVIVTV